MGTNRKRKPRFPKLDAKQVARLAKLADEIDGAEPGSVESEVEAFNREAGTTLAFLDFQGISGGQDHAEWVRNVLAAARKPPVLTRSEAVELVRRILQNEIADRDLEYWIDVLAENLGDSQFSDLVFWPGEYFGDGNDSRVMTAEEIVETSLARSGKVLP